MIRARKEEVATRLVEEVGPLVAAQPISTNPLGLRNVAEHIERRLQALGFRVDRYARGGSPDVMRATRAGVGSGWVGLCGHYDVAEAGDGWIHPPFAVTADGGRLYGRGLADNLGPLCLRLIALDMLGECAPGMVFVLQGEEEVGSPAAHQLYPDLDLPVVDLWLEETGYFELDGSQRLLVRRITATTEPWVRAAVALAESQKRTVCRHDRYLNKAFGEQQCPFLAHLVGDTTYLAIGPNDPESRIHRPDESLAIANLAIAVEQFQAVMTAAVGAR